MCGSRKVLSLKAKVGWFQSFFKQQTKLDFRYMQESVRGQGVQTNKIFHERGTWIFLKQYITYN